VNRYGRARHQRETGEAPGWMRPLNLIGGLALVIAGLLFLPTPGPGYIIIVLGLWMMAGEWLPLARFFDWLELRLRWLGRRIKALWSRSSTPAKFLVILASVAMLGCGVYLLFG
jgi:hypothetical protein